MNKSQQRPERQFALKTRRAFVAALVVVVTLAAVFMLTSRRPKSIEWIPYSAVAVAKNKSQGRSSVVLFYARWTLSADPKGGLVTPAVSQSLADAGFIAMDADLTDYAVGSFDEFKEQGLVAIPVLVLYPTTGPCVSFHGGTPESEIVSTVERLSR